MLTIRSVQGTVKAPLYRTAVSAQRAFLAKPTSLVSYRFQSSTATTPSPVSSTPKISYVKIEGTDKNYLRRKEKPKKASDKNKGEARVAEAHQWQNRLLTLDTRLDRITKHLDIILQTRQRVGRLLTSKNFHVQTYPIEAPLPGPPGPIHVHGENNTVSVAATKIPNIWLRDNCQCSSCMHESTKQRLLDTFSIPKDIHVVKFENTRSKALDVEWSDGHKSTYPREFLFRAIQGSDIKALTRQALQQPTLWDASIANAPPSVPHDLTNLTPLLQNLRTHGFCYVDNVAHPDPAATETLLKSIAFIRETHYGGFYDFTADLASQDTAYTNIALEAHTDTTYFSDPAGLQAFHLLSHTDGEGGASLLVDGFKCAQELYETDREAYQILSTVDVHGHASGNEGISIQPYRGFPVLEHDPATNILLRVRWNSSDRAAIGLPVDKVEMWYDAARKFDALLKKKENEYWQQLVPGKVLIFDNWRVLHGRSAFTGTRRICGGYINRDDWISRYKMETSGKEEVLGALASG